MDAATSTSIAAQSLRVTRDAADPTRDDVQKETAFPASCFARPAALCADFARPYGSARTDDAAAPPRSLLRGPSDGTMSGGPLPWIATASRFPVGGSVEMCRSLLSQMRQRSRSRIAMLCRPLCSQRVALYQRNVVLLDMANMISFFDAMSEVDPGGDFAAQPRQLAAEDATSLLALTFDGPGARFDALASHLRDPVVVKLPLEIVVFVERKVPEQVSLECSAVRRLEREGRIFFICCPKGRESADLSMVGFLSCASRWHQRPETERPSSLLREKAHGADGAVWTKKAVENAKEEVNELSSTIPKNRGDDDDACYVTTTTVYHVVSNDRRHSRSVTSLYRVMPRDTGDESHEPDGCTDAGGDGSGPGASDRSAMPITPSAVHCCGSAGRPLWPAWLVFRRCPQQTHTHLRDVVRELIVT